MTELVWAGTFVGALLGAAHAVYVYRLLAREPPASSSPVTGRPVYYALWTFGLWVLFGTYTLVLGVASVVLYAVFGAFRR